ncbi:MAG: protein kinase, partial [Planctomycetota bacterium]
MAPLRAGERIGPYQIETLIGKGGMGAVYLAHDRSLDRRVAIKVLPQRFLGDREVVARFHREALALAKLRHPNLMHIYKVGSHGGRPFFAMEYVKGRTVEALIKQTGRIRPPQAAHIAAEVMSALDKVHRAAIVHRDIKPGNIMIDEDGRAILMDFGLARQESDIGLTADHTVLGTPRYMSPEQAKGERVDPRSDIYSLGCVIYEMVTGRPPFRGKSALEVLRKHIESTVPPPSELADDVPPGLDEVIARATAKRPDDRYQSVAEMAADLAGLYRIGPLVRLAAASGQGSEPTAPLAAARADYPSTVRLRRTVRSPPARPRRGWVRRLLQIGIGAAAGVLLGL